jgi:hypothetical protein
MRAEEGKTHIIVIKNCLVTLEANMNLLATCNLQKAGVSFRTTAHSKAAMLELKKNNKKVVFDLTFDNSLYKLPFYQDVATHFAGAFSHQLRALKKHELWNCRLSHTSSEKIAKLSQRCHKGISRPLTEHNLVCHQCQEGKAKRANFLPELTN